MLPEAGVSLSDISNELNIDLKNHVIKICSGITSGRVLDGVVVAQMHKW